MNLIKVKFKNQEIGELVSQSTVVNNIRDGVELIANVHNLKVNKIILHEKHFCTEFFDLSTKIAGEILQKFTTYNIRVAIVGEFEKYKSKNLRDFIYESNKGGSILFLKSTEEAKERLTE